MNRILITMAAAGLFAGAANAEPQSFETPDAAVGAVVAALEAADADRLTEIFGPEHQDLILSGDTERDREDWAGFLEAYNAFHRLGVDGNVATLFVGDEQWPAPIPVVRVADGDWRFDVEAGRDEIEARRIGRNELDVIDLLRGYVRVQTAYRQVDYDGDGVMEFASAILSDAGERNGLHWPAEDGAPESPIGDFMARASSQGFSVGDSVAEPEPYLGYYFRILHRQGEGAAGGAHEYIVNGNMVGGHAIIAFPSSYGETGIMTLMVGENGVVYEADLGDDTLDRAVEIESFDPSGEWLPVAE